MCTWGSINPGKIHFPVASIVSVSGGIDRSVPILVIPGGYPRTLANRYPNFSSSLNMRHVTKWAEPLTMGAAVPEVMRRAFYLDPVPAGQASR